MTPHDLQLIFQAPFNYTLYSQEIVHRLFGCNDVEQQPYPIDTSAAGDLSHYVGQMEDSDGRLLGFFYTRVAEGSDVRRKRVGLRKLIQPYLRYEVDAAIAVFDDGQHWQLSYICDHKDNVTAAKRFSYILGDEKGQYKTPRERLEKVADMKGHFKLSDLKAAFSVETLSDEFFKEYHNHYDNIVSELARQGKTGAVFHDYVKKMMGRIVFLHFLQKKGWLNDNPAFLRDLFFFSPYQTDFLEQVLEPLFFGIFNTETEQRERLFDIEHWDKGLLKQWENLPYLNGGLFERDEVDKVHIKLPASLFEKLFEFMSSYNFTVDENDPDDADIGIDPEMLGKIFESLLEDNKSKGAFYTPKEIVRYMCKESLIAYLDSKLETSNASEKHNLNNPIQESKQLSQCGDVGTKGECVPEVRDLKQSIRAFVEQHEQPEELEPYRDVLDTALREVKICDPAIGSGAFPMGLLNELWRCREAIEEVSSRADLKKQIIENNIYGVDVERGAIDIARLRFWLSIVVDADKPEPLPNFDYKFMQGNSLIESYKGIDLSRISARQRGGQSKSTQLLLGLDSDLSRKNLQRLMRDYFSVTDHKQKASMRQAINDEVKSLIRDFIGGTDSDLATLDPSANQDFFLWHTWFKDIFDNGGFDIVIGNPPYIRRTELPEHAKVQYEKDYKSAVLQYDIYLLFIEFGLTICNQKSHLCLINPIRFFSSDYGIGCRPIIIKNNYLWRVVDVSQIEVFKNAMTYPCVLHIQKQELKDYIVEFYAPENLQVMSDLQRLDCKYLFKRDIVNDPSCRILVSEGFGIIQKINKNSKPIETWFKVSRGLPNNKVDFAGNKYRALKSTMVKKYRITDLYKTIDTNYSATFKDEMIILPRTVLFLQATLKEKDVVLLDRIYYLTRKTSVNTRFILGVINAKLTNYWFEHYYSTTKVSGGYFDLNGTQMKSIPIPFASTDKQNDISNIVAKILSIKNSNSGVDTSDLEHEIDQQVYAIYNLTPEEIAIIEQ